METQRLIALVAVVLCGVAAQWVAWRLSLPSILLLLACGIIVGPVTGWIDPDYVLGDLLLPFISLAVAVILFEGGLTLRFSELREVGRVVWRLVTVGVIATWLLSAAGAWLAGLAPGMALLVGSILVVTGPTVVGPLLRHIRPRGEVGPILKWEGIITDPLGAVLAVLVLEALLEYPSATHAVTTAALRMAATLGAGTLLGLAAAALFVVLLRWFWIPDHLINPFAVMVVFGVFALANAVQPEAGLVATTVTGIALANQRLVDIREILEFKEDLRVLLISIVFVVLGARFERGDLAHLTPPVLAFLAALILIVRPLVIALATAGTGLSLRAKAFLAGVAPRGIVAAAVASVFALHLRGVGYPQADLLLPVIFAIIIVTVTVYSLAAAPLARLLGLADPDPQGLLVVGAHEWARRLARLLRDRGIRVLLIDINRPHVLDARMEGLEAHPGNVLSEHLIDELDLGGVGRLLALTSNDSVNLIAAQRFAAVFGRHNVFRLPPATGGSRPDRSPPGSGRWLFRQDATFDEIEKRYLLGWSFKATPLGADFGVDRFRERYPDAIPLLLHREGKRLIVVTAFDSPQPRAGDTIIALVPPDAQ